MICDFIKYYNKDTLLILFYLTLLSDFGFFDLIQ
ncbi:MAG: hypothetical protein H6Q19_2058 [Bacteroidetes bacterium]|nr:hypothetical protein [Bacteroidota bacterium]